MAQSPELCHHLVEDLHLSTALDEVFVHLVLPVFGERVFDQVGVVADLPEQEHLIPQL